jgi:hypothetical protein
MSSIGAKSFPHIFISEFLDCYDFHLFLRKRGREDRKNSRNNLSAQAMSRGRVEERRWPKR